MSDSEKRIRKQWLSLLLVGLCVSMIGHFIQSQQLFNLNQMPIGGLALFLIPLLFQLAFSYIIYYCAYQKPGTKLLLFCLILTGFSVALTPILYFLGFIKNPGYIPFYGIYLTLSEALGIFWTITCWKMRSINQRLKALSNS